MFVSDRMSREIHTVDQASTVCQAAEVMARAGVHQLPVVADNVRLVGIITDRDVRSVHDSPAMDGPVAAIMTADPIAVFPGAPLEDALQLLHRHRFGALPVVTYEREDLAEQPRRPRLVGIISRTDILSALIEMLGLDEPGTRIEIELPEQSVRAVVGAINAIADSETRVISMTFSGRPPGDPGEQATRRLYVRLSTIDPRRAMDALAAAGYKLANPICEIL
jgi:acetoin utilization protein AcuB